MNARPVRSIVWLSGLALAALASLGIVWGSMRSKGPALSDRNPGGPLERVAVRSVPQKPSQDKPPPRNLDKTERELLWQIEHHGLALSRYGFQPLADALRNDDAGALADLMAPGFTGQAPQQAKEVVLENEFAHVVRTQDAGHPPESLDRAQFTERLVSLRKPFTRTPKVKLALMALAPTVRDDLDKPWQGTCQLRMWGEQGKGQPREVVTYLRYEVERPDEPTLRKGAWLRACALTQIQEAHASRFLMREATSERGIDPGRYHDNWTTGQKWQVTGGAYLCDYDRDGWLDLLTTDINGYALYKGLPGGNFTNVTAQVGLPVATALTIAGLGITAAVADLDGDGWEDIILGDAVYRNKEGKAFENLASKTNLRMPSELTGIIVADYDRDGRLDLYMTRSGKPKAASWLDGKSGDSQGNELLHNMGNWQFENVTEKSGAAGGYRSTFSAVWFDADNDGWPDLYVVNEFGNGVLLVNQRNGQFSEHKLVEGPSDFGSMGVTCGDIDNDGNIDLYVANMYSKAGNRVIGNLQPDAYPPDIMARMRTFTTGSQLHHNLGGLKFEQLGQSLQVADVGWSYGPALVDLDNDGWLDIYAPCGFFSQSRTEPDG